MVKNLIGSHSNRYKLIYIISLLVLLLTTSCNPLSTISTYPPVSPSNGSIPTPTSTPPSPSSTLYTPLGSSIEFTVVRIIDGDTIEVKTGNEFYDVRYIGIDAPELGESFGVEAMEKNRELIEGKTIRLEKDISETDQYNRLLGYIYVDDTFVNAELVRLGYAQAVSYPPNTKHDNLFKDLETKAKDVNIGLWEINQSTKTAPNTTKITPPPRD